MRIFESKVQGPKAKAAFTLIELLVVVAIIAVLISILLPALSQARDAARIVACQSNLRQVGFAVRQYLDDYKGYLWAVDCPSWWTSWWYVLYTPGADWRNRSDPTVSGLAAAIGTVLACPADGAPFDEYATLHVNQLKGVKLSYAYNEWAGYTAYGNWYYPSDAPWIGRNLNQIGDPSRAPLVTDLNNKSWMGVIDMPAYYQVYNQELYAETLYRHKNITKSNVLFLDGHVGSLIKYQTTSGMYNWWLSTKY